jgi:hypothetical protein
MCRYKPRINAYDRLYGKDVFMNTMMPWEFQRLVKENGFEVLDGQGVFKKGIDEKVVQQYPIELQQSLTFMWLFMLKKKDTL